MNRGCRAILSVALVLAAVPAHADTLIKDINGISVDREGRTTNFRGLVIDDQGIITHVLQRGDDPPEGNYYEIDGNGRTIIPGMVDSHVHVMGIGFGQLTLDLSATASLEEALAAIAEYARTHPDRPWIVGRGWNQEAWSLGRFPTAAELDAVVADRPVWLKRVDGHAGWANSAALRAAGIGTGTADPDGGRILRKAGSREPAGVLVDSAMKLVDAHLPAPRPEDRDIAFGLAQRSLLRMGVTAVADMGTSIEDWQTYRRAGDNGTLYLRIMAYADGVEAMELIGGPGPTPWLYDDRLRLNGVKLFLDGALGSRGALLKTPYADDPNNHGLSRLNSTQLRNLMSRAALDNFQVAIHAIGDAANADVLDAIAELAETYTGDRRWRIEHAQILDPADIPRLGMHGIIASMQPLHQSSDRLMAEVRLGPDRLDGAYAWRSILAAGGTLAFGSDAPVEPADPLAGWAVAISREDAKGQPFGGWRVQEAVSREQALAAYTANAAWAGFGEGRFGRIEVGERADFVMLDRDPLLANAQDIRRIKVLETWVGGRKLYDSTPDEPPRSSGDRR